MQALVGTLGQAVRSLFTAIPSPGDGKVRKASLQLAVVATTSQSAKDGVLPELEHMAHSSTLHQSWQVTLIPGDGIGPEVTRAVLDVVEAIKVGIERCHTELL